MKYLFILMVFISSKIFAQKQYGASWIVGSGITYRVNFSGGSTKISYFDTNYVYRFILGSSCISDSNGNLKLLSNGYQLFDSFGVHIENGDFLVPDLIYTKYFGFSGYPQSSIILPFDSGVYYLLTPTASNAQVINWNNNLSFYFDLLIYHKVDMNENGGAGRVVKKAVPLLEHTPLSKTQMMACRHSSGEGWWLLKQASDTNMVYKFLVTKDSIYTMGMQGFTEPHFGTYDLAGQSMFNQSGTQYATTCSSTNDDYLFLADFDRCSGVLSNQKLYRIPDYPKTPSDSSPDISPSGMCFSPNGRFIYLLKYYNIFQLDLEEPDSADAWHHVVNLDTTEQAFTGFGSAYIGPDNRVYVSNWGAIRKEMSYIKYPDIKGAGCSFCARCLQFLKLGGVGTVPCMPNYALGKDSLHHCPLPVFSPPPVNHESLLIYPNPGNGLFTIESSLLNQQENEIVLLSINGEKLYRKKVSTATGKIEVDISHLASGMYILKVGEVVRKVVKE